jgi:carbamoyltransferase
LNILGISSYYHDSAACLIKDGRIAAAAQEERFNRRKYCSDFPIQAINYCIQEGNITFEDIDYIGFYEKPFLKFSRVIIDHLQSYPYSFGNFLRTIPLWLQDRLTTPLTIKRELGYDGQILFVKHHLSHAASAFLVSPFDEAAILTCDGVGEWSTVCCCMGKGNSIKILRELHYPDSLGLLYTAVTTFLGFRANGGEGKVMGLAAYGEPSYLHAFKKIADIKPDGSFKLDSGYFGFNKGSRMYGKRFVKLFGTPREPESESESESEPESEPEKRYKDIAASLQVITEQAVINIARNLHRETGSSRICLAGGVFLNCLINHKILELTPFKEIFIQPAAGDSGGALGAAAYINNTLMRNPRTYVMDSAALGPEFSDSEIKRHLMLSGLNFIEYVEEDELLKFVAEKLAKNCIIGWFQGRMEFGPRALGNRSILANPAAQGIKDIVNKKVKHRELFRPFAASVLAGSEKEFFDLLADSPFMLLAAQVRNEKKNLIHGVTHVDGTSRVQVVNIDASPKFFKLIYEFKKLTGLPLILNTSFNLRGEPIVCTPRDAIDCYQRSSMDYLVLGNFIATGKKTGISNGKPEF